MLTNRCLQPRVGQGLQQRRGSRHVPVALAADRMLDRRLQAHAQGQQVLDLCRVGIGCGVLRAISGHAALARTMSEQPEIGRECRGTLRPGVMRFRTQPRPAGKQSGHLRDSAGGERPVGWSRILDSDGEWQMRILLWATVGGFVVYNADIAGGGHFPSAESYLYGLAFFVGPFVVLLLAAAVGLTRGVVQVCTGVSVFFVAMVTLLSLANQATFVAPALLMIFGLFSVAVLLGALLARSVRAVLSRLRRP